MKITNISNHHLDHLRPAHLNTCTALKNPAGVSGPGVVVDPPQGRPTSRQAPREGFFGMTEMSSPNSGVILHSSGIFREKNNVIQHVFQLLSHRIHVWYIYLHLEHIWVRLPVGEDPLGDVKVSCRKICQMYP